MQKYKAKVLNTKQTIIGLSLACVLLFSSQLSAATLQASATIESTRLFQGTNLTNDDIAYSLAGDWTFDNGAFTGIDCYTSDIDQSEGLKNGCDYYAGYFTQISSKQAITLLATHHDFARSHGQEWGFTELEASWHINQQATVSATYAKEWFNRSIDTFSIKGDIVQNLSEHFSVNVSASLMALENPAPFDSITFARAGLQYHHRRWTAEAAIIYSDRKLETMLPFDVDQPEVSFSLTYRLY